MVSYSWNSRFKKQIKKLLKKYRTLEEDLKIVEKAAIELLHINRIDNRSVELVPGFNKKYVKIFKIKKFACKSLPSKGVRSGIRVIYAFFPEQTRVEYLEIYYKEKSNHDMNYNFARSYITEQEIEII